MILFIVEGEKREPQIIHTVAQLFLQKSKIIWSFKNNITALYRAMVKLDAFEGSADTLQVLKELKADKELENVTSDQIESIYLFFDYDLSSLKDKYNHNTQLKEMLKFFSNETEKGRLYINYPMVEAFLYTKKLPDLEYYNYTVKADIGKNFKQMTSAYSDYKNTKHLLYNLPNPKKADKSHIQHDDNQGKRLFSNWLKLNSMNICKANYICKNYNNLPNHKEDVSQLNILKNQFDKYIIKDSVAVLFSFSLFLFDYYRDSELILEKIDFHIR